MITAAIGRIFLDAYNEKYGTKYDAKTFFVEVYHPLFFDSNKYFQWISNSPFVQMKKGQKVETLTPDERRVKLQVIMSKVEENAKPDASIAPGFPASETKEFSTTSGQVTDLDFMTEKEDFYLSWIGSGFGVGLQGKPSMSILFFNPEILLDIFEGWKLYRKALDETDKLAGNKVNTWNGQWIAHRYDKGNYYAEQPMAGFNPFETTKEGMSIAAQSWTKVLIGIARHFTFPKIMGYVYRFDKTNTTIGFIPFNLEHIRRPIELYKRLFGEEEGRKAEELWGTGMGFKACCQKGAIGIEAMRPKDIEQYMIADKGKDIKLPQYDENQSINFHIYQIWLLAMLNNQEMWDKSYDFAKSLFDVVAQDKSISTQRKNIVKFVLSSTTKKSFMSSLEDLVPISEDTACIKETAGIVNLMPSDNVPYFLTLVRFHYAVIEKEQ